MAADLTAYQEAMKIYYAPAIVEQLNQESILLSRLQRDSEHVSGLEVKIPLHTRRNVGIGARAENAALPTAGRQGFSSATFNVRYHYGTIDLSGPLMAATASNKGAFVQALDNEITGMVNDFKRNINRALFGNGNAELAVAGAMGAAGLTVPVDSVKYLQAGMIVDIWDTSAGAYLANGTGREIASVDPDALTITLTAGSNVQTAAGDVVCLGGSRGVETVGLKLLVSNTGTVQNIDSSLANNAFWRAYVNANSGTLRSISETLMQTVWDKVEENGGKVSLMISNYGARRAYQNLLTSLKRYSSPMQLEGGWTALEYNGKPFTVDPDCQANRIYFLDESHLTIYETNSPHWAEEDGNVLHRKSGYDAWEAFFVWYMILGTDKRNVFALLDDITEA